MAKAPKDSTPDAGNNAEGFETLVNSLPEMPDDARLALGRSMARSLDAQGTSLQAALAKEYRALIDALGETEDEETDVFDQYT